MFTLDSVEVFRRPAEYLLWFQALVERTKGNREEHVAALAHKGLFKVLYEEIFPLASLLRVKSEAWREAEFRNVLGNQAYDVEIRNHALNFIEIVTTDFDDGQRFRMMQMIERGSVDAIGPIHRDARGRPVGITGEGAMRLRDDVVRERLDLACDRLSKKATRDYPKGTALLIYIDDFSVAIDPDDRVKFSQLLRSTRDVWASTFQCAFIVGPKSELFCEEDLA